MPNPPPIPAAPAGYWRRTFACLADIIPLMILGWVAAKWLAGPEELAALKRSDEWMHHFIDQYLRALQGNSPRDLQAVMDMAMHPQEKDIEAIALWGEFQGTVSFFVMLLGLTFQEWLMQGQSLGKRILHIRTVDVIFQNPPTFVGCLLRSAWKAAFFTLPNPITIVLGIINFHLPLFRRDGRTWHDLWSKTQVVVES